MLGSGAPGAVLPRVVVAQPSTQRSSKCLRIAPSKMNACCSSPQPSAHRIDLWWDLQ
ncbi:hypothetical protein F751_1829 [Auxenochlorella protothecoides]|uniref:Uncharacterized protein n=1 Tax=Auxenochlorella protothecoides TaxID=3075 RepID=A0A087SGU6_AUXPR|nr:hypothetical protein F751_1829 [Auxenochlorella protothecoides]KFM24950.1 hypothetical protein F751_1829 [Auxenochlorella protothecoides]